MTKVIIVGDMTFGETAPPPGTPGQLPSGGFPPPVAGQLPVFPPSPPGAPDQGLPAPPGAPLPPIGLPPGQVWPPLPPGTPAPHKVVAIVAVPGVGYRYTVVELSDRPVDPGYGRPEGGRPDQGLPGRPDRPDWERPPHVDQGLPGGRPVRPDQGLPSEPTPEPKRF